MSARVSAVIFQVTVGSRSNNNNSRVNDDIRMTLANSVNNNPMALFRTD